MFYSARSSIFIILSVSPGHSKVLAMERRGVRCLIPYTEMDNITSSKLTLISEQALKNPKFKFTSLAHLLNKGFLKECYYELGRDRSGGMDSVSWKEYGENLDESIRNLVSRLKDKRYKLLPVKWTYVPKN